MIFCLISVLENNFFSKFIYSNKWWCFHNYHGCKDCEHYTQGLITTEYDTNCNDNTIQSVKIYRTPVPPPPSFESNTMSNSHTMSTFVKISLYN